MIDFSQMITAKARAADALQARRATMTVSRLQGRLVLGPDACARLDAIAADPNENWGLRETIANATEWRRSSETMAALGWVMGFSDDEMDALFEKAMLVAT